MEYTIKKLDTEEYYTVGNYYVNSRDDVFRIIKDRERGYALLEVSDGFIESEFHEDIDSLIKYTTLGEMKLLKQIGKAYFE